MSTDGEDVRQQAAEAIDRLTRVAPDFPLPGIMFRDLTPVLADAGALRLIGEALGTGFPSFDLVAGLESRGFLLATAVALTHHLGVLAIRKPGKLPGKILAEDYDLEYGSARLELNPLDVPPGARVLIVDDVLATGGTASAACRLLQRAGATVSAVSVAIELAELGGRARLGDVPLRTLRTY